MVGCLGEGEMRAIVNWLLWFVMWLLMFGMICTMLFVRSCCPELTQTEFFIEYWWCWLVMGALGVWMIALSNYEQRYRLK